MKSTQSEAKFAEVTADSKNEVSAACSRRWADAHTDAERHNTFSAR